MPLWALVLLFCLVFLLESISAVPSEHVGTSWAHFAVTTSVGSDEPVLTYRQYPVEKARWTDTGQGHLPSSLNENQLPWLG